MRLHAKITKAKTQLKELKTVIETTAWISFVLLNDLLKKVF
jgi:hypothetical protein